MAIMTATWMASGDGRGTAGGFGASPRVRRGGRYDRHVRAARTLRVATGAPSLPRSVTACAALDVFAFAFAVAFAFLLRAHAISLARDQMNVTDIGCK